MNARKRFGFGVLTFVFGVALIIVLAQTAALTTFAQAEESAAAFYKGKTVELVVPYAPGGPYDNIARLLAPLMAKELAASVIVKNEPGAGAMVALNRLARENNGLSMVTCDFSAAAMAQVFEEEGARFDLAKFNWLGKISLAQDLIAVSKLSGLKSIADLQKAKEVKFGGDTRKSGSSLRPLVAGYLLGINVNLITGYRGAPAEMMSMLKGEVQAVSTTIPMLAPYLKSQEVIPLLAMARQRFKALPDIPTIYEIKKLSDREKRVADICTALNVGRVVATTPGVPQARVALLESVLKKAVEDREFLKKMESMQEIMGYDSAKNTTDIMRTMLITGEEKKLFGKFLAVEGY